MHTHAAGSAFHNAWPWPLTFRPQGQCMMSDCSAMHCMSTKFGVDCSRRFSVRARTHRQGDRQTHIKAHTRYWSPYSMLGYSARVDNYLAYHLYAQQTWAHVKKFTYTMTHEKTTRRAAGLFICIKIKHSSKVCSRQVWNVDWTTKNKRSRVIE